MSLFAKKLFLNLNPLVESYDLTKQTEPMFYIDLEHVNPNLIRVLNEQDITLLTPLCFYKKPLSRGKMHIDGLNPGDYTKLNYIITGNNSFMEWYEVPLTNIPIPSKVNINGGGNYLEFSSRNNVLLEKQVLSGWNLVQAGVPHNVFNYCNTPRYCISFTIYYRNNRITMQEGLDLFSQYFN